MIAWNMLKAGLEELLREEVLQDFNWRLNLDSPEKLRFSEAGLTIQPDRSLFGETVPGTTSATIRQSTWTEGLELEMMIRHDTSLPLPLFERLQEKLDYQYWEASNDPHFTASLDMEDSILMTEPMSYRELAVTRPRFFWTRIWGKTVSQERGWKCKSGRMLVGLRRARLKELN